MDEYIDREAISEEIRKYYYKNPPNSSYGEGFDRGLDRAQRAILDAPAADVVPVVHGKWIVRFDGPYNRRRCYCSHCGRHNGVGGIAQNQEKPYCPNCGAKMDGGDK